MTAYDSSYDHRTRVSVPSRRDLGLFGTLAGVFLTLKPTSRGSPDVPTWLRRDIGLPPADDRRGYWEIR